MTHAQTVPTIVAIAACKKTPRKVLPEKTPEITERVSYEARPIASALNKEVQTVLPSVESICPPKSSLKKNQNNAKVTNWPIV